MIITTVIFDYGGVITTKRRSKLLDEWAQKTFGLEEGRMFEAFNNDAVYEYSRGRLTSAQFFGKVCQRVGREINKAVFAEILKEVNSADEAIMSLVEALYKAGFDLCLISDSFPEFTAGVRDQLGRFFRVMVFSEEEGFLKGDDGKLFDVAFERIGTPPAECVYIDDKPALLDYPRSHGVNCILFESHHQLCSELAKLSVIA